jgi:hypothetical protein
VEGINLKKILMRKEIRIWYQKVSSSKMKAKAEMMTTRLLEVDGETVRGRT